MGLNHASYPLSRTPEDMANGETGTMPAELGVNCSQVGLRAY